MGIFSDVLLTVDYDRTLTAPDSTIPQKNLAAIRYFMDNGGAFTLNTGRSIPMSLNNILSVVPVNAPLLLYNGSAAFDTQTNTFTRSTPLPFRPRPFLEDLQEKFPDLNVEVQGVDAHYLVRKNPRWEAYCDHNRCPWGYAEPEDIPGPFIKVALYGEFRENTVAGMYEATAEELALFDRAIGYIESQYGDRVDVFRACARIADIHTKGCSKLNSARQLQRELGKKILVCVGDADNDLTMLEGADYAFCPADGVVADRFPNVCNCADGAIAEVIYEKIPEILRIQP